MEWFLPPYSSVSHVVVSWLGPEQLPVYLLTSDGHPYQQWYLSCLLGLSWYKYQVVSPQF